MGRTTDYYFIAYFVLFCWSSVQSVDVFRSCLDVLNSAGRNSTKDGEYTIFLENKVGVSIYCHGKLSLFIYPRNLWVCFGTFQYL